VSPADDPRAAQTSVRDQLVAAAHREPDPSRTAQTALRDALVAAGVREHDGAVAAQRGQRRRRRHRRTAGFVVVALLGAAAVAEGTGLISVGEPIKPNPGLEGDPKITAANGDPMEVVATAPDAQRKVSYGVAIYRSAAGHRCVIAGQLRGNQLGLERDGVFHRFSDLRPGICLEGGRRTSDIVNVEGTPPRTLIYGLQTDPAETGTVTLRATGAAQQIKPVRGGAWLLVFDGRLTPADFTLKRP